MILYIKHCLRFKKTNSSKQFLYQKPEVRIDYPVWDSACAIATVIFIFFNFKNTNVSHI
jgi:hypothetical protein